MEVKPMSIFSKVKQLNLPKGEYAVFGSGVLEAHKIRKTKDVDLAVSKNLFFKLKNEGWEPSEKNPEEIIAKGEYEAFYKFTSKNYNPNVPSLIKNAELINGIPFVQLEETIKFKKALGRPKDLIDLKLIEKYLRYKP
jgi:hypothetical protein